MQHVHRVSESTSDIACMKSPACEAVSHQPSIYDYILVNDVHPNSSSGDSNSTELGPRPLDAPAVLPQVGIYVGRSYTLMPNTLHEFVGHFCRDNGLIISSGKGLELKQCK